MKKLFIVYLLTVFASIICAAQTNTTTNWGEPVCGVQMSITTTNNVIAVGSTIVLHCRIKNSSTNVVAMGSTGQPIYDFNISLVDSSGKLHDLRPKDKFPRPFFMNTLIGINSGEIYECDIPLRIDSDIPAGNSKFKVTRSISIQKKWYALISNLLEIQIK
jgi:hypothetical protein